MANRQSAIENRQLGPFRRYSLAIYQAGIRLIPMARKAAKPEEKVQAPGKPSSLIDTRVIYCGDHLEQKRNRWGKPHPTRNGCRGKEFFKNGYC
jgi:hypothetical protein